MKFFAMLMLSVALIALGPSSTSAQTDKENVIAAARALETAPVDKKTAGMIERAIKWTIETDDVHLIACGGTFTLFSDKKNKQSSHMTGAYMVGMAAYRLQNPNADENAVQLAGLETALKAYEIAVVEKPKTKSDQIEALLAKRSNGELAALVKAADCGKK